jgi:hypothetical protein
MVDQYNPYGSLTYEQTGTGPGGVPMWTSSLKLSPEQQQLFDTLQGTKGIAGQQGQTLLQGAAYGARPAGEVIGDATAGNTRAIMDNMVGYLQPFQATEKQQLDTQLRNQGLAPGTPGYDNAMRSLDTNHSLAVQNFLGTIQPQAYEQAYRTYNLPAELSAKLAGLGAPGDPTQDLIQTPQLSIKPADLTGAYSASQSAAMDQYKAELAQQQSMMSGLFGIPTAVVGGLAANPMMASKGLSAMSGLFGSQPLSK